MSYLLDTCVWLWLVSEPERIGKDLRALLADETTPVFFSAASAWEIAIKAGLGRLELPKPPAEFIAERLVRDTIRALPVEVAHAAHVATLPMHHRDPFDRLLVAQAQIEDLTLVSADRQLHPYNVKLILVAS